MSEPKPWFKSVARVVLDRGSRLFTCRECADYCEPGLGAAVEHAALHGHQRLYVDEDGVYNADPERVEQ